MIVSGVWMAERRNMRAGTRRAGFARAAAWLPAVVAAVLLQPAPARSAGLAPSPWDVQVFQTTRDLKQRLTRVPEVWFERAKQPAGIKVIHVNDRTGYQRVVGVGGAMTDSSAWLIHNELGAATRNGLMQNLFGTGESIGLRATADGRLGFHRPWPSLLLRRSARRSERPATAALLRRPR